MVTTDRERAEQYVEELYGVTINKKTGQTRAGVRREYWVELFEHIVAAVRAERDAEWSAAADEGLQVINQLVARMEPPRAEPLVNNVMEIKFIKLRDALNALIEEVK